MPDSPVNPRLQPVSPNLRVDAAAQRVDVSPVMQQGGPMPDTFTALTTAVKALQAANDALTARVAQLEKDMFAAKLLLTGADTALKDVKQSVTDLRAEYQTHGHKLNFSMQPYSLMASTRGDDQKSFVLPYIWTGDKPNSYTDYQRHLDGVRYGGFTQPPQQPPKPGDPVE